MAEKTNLNYLSGHLWMTICNCKNIMDNNNITKFQDIHLTNKYNEHLLNASLCFRHWGVTSTKQKIALTSWCLYISDKCFYLSELWPKLIHIALFKGGHFNDSSNYSSMNLLTVRLYTFLRIVDSGKECIKYNQISP